MLMGKREGGATWLQGLREVPYLEASEALCSLPGVGPKVRLFFALRGYLTTEIRVWISVVGGPGMRLCWRYESLPCARPAVQHFPAHGPKGMGFRDLLWAARVQRLHSMLFTDSEQSQRQSHERLGIPRASWTQGPCALCYSYHPASKVIGSGYWLSLGSIYPR